MRLPLLLLPVLTLLLSACYEVRDPVVTTGIRVEGAKDGHWRRSDGSDITLAWNERDRAYDVGVGGQVRLAPAGTLYMVDYGAERRIALLAAVQDGEIVLLQPRPQAERKLLAARSLTLKPGPINRLVGSPPSLRDYFSDLAALAGSGDLIEVERLTWMADSR